MERETTAPPLAQLAPDPRKWALFLDFDGTLVELAPRPDAITVPSGLPVLLRELSDTYMGALAVVTGRPLADLDARLAGANLPAAGQHGAEKRIHPSRPAETPDTSRLSAARRRVEAGVRGRPGVLVEDKGASLALHYRSAPDSGDFLERLAASVVAESSGELELLPGKAVYEIRIAGMDKGKALTAFLGHPPFAGRLPLVVGDDVTDEAAFAAALEAGGTAVKIGEGETLAPWRIDTPRTVRDWLARRVNAGNMA